ncbi:MAG: tetratricopeptide repeat protein, partial [Verrucomicrobiota bacterium]
LSYALSLVCFVVSLMSKAWGIVLPAVLLVLVWQQGQFKQVKVLLLAWLPFALLALVFAVLAIYAQSQLALADTEAHGLGARLIQALWSPAFYLWKTLFPLNLSPLYLLRHDFQPLAFPYVLGALVTLSITVFAVIKAKRWPGFIAAWLIFLILIAPVSGLAQSGSQLAADRYTYLAGIVLAFGLSWGGGWLCRYIIEARGALLSAAVILLLLSMGLSTRQSLVWADETRLWSRALAHDPDNYVAAFNRAQTGADGLSTEQRLTDLNLAVEQYPGYAKAWALRGEIHLSLGQTGAAQRDLDQAIALDPNTARPYNNRAVLEMNQGKTLEAMDDFNAALERDPSFFEAYVNRGLLHQRMGHPEAALVDYEKALALNSVSWQLHYNRALLLRDFGQIAAASEAFRRAQQLLPPDSPHAGKISSQLQALQP